MPYILTSRPADDAELARRETLANAFGDCCEGLYVERDRDEGVTEVRGLANTPGGWVRDELPLDASWRAEAQAALDAMRA